MAYKVHTKKFVDEILLISSNKFMSYIFTNSQLRTYYYLDLLFNHDKLLKLM